MRQLIGKIDPSAWAEVSAFIFALCFLLLVVWVFLPSRKKTYQDGAQLPLENGSRAQSTLGNKKDE